MIVGSVFQRVKLTDKIFLVLENYLYLLISFVLNVRKFPMFVSEQEKILEIDRDFRVYYHGFKWYTLNVGGMFKGILKKDFTLNTKKTYRWNIFNDCVGN